MTPTLARRYTIAGLQIFGGLYGFAGTAQILVSVDSWLARLVDLVILMFFVLCFAAGMLLYRDHDWGASLSLYLQVPQLVFVYSSTLIFNVFGGLSASLSLTTPLSIKLNLTPGFSAYFSLLNDLDHITLGVNLVAVVTLWQLLVYLDAKDNPQPPTQRPLGVAWSSPTRAGRNFCRFDPYKRVAALARIPIKENPMPAAPSRFSVPALAVIAGLASFVATPLAGQAVSNAAEFEAWRKVQKEDIDGLREKFMALAKAVPANKHSWKPMEGTRSFHEVFAHVAAEGNTETAMFGGKLPEGSLADFDAEEARLSKLPDDQLIAVMEKSMKTLSATVAGLSLDKMNTPITYYGQSTLPRVATTYTLNDLHEHLGQLVSYARMNQIVPPWSKKTG